MILGVISDTHDKDDSAYAAFDYFKSRSITTIFHCGDWKTPNFFEAFIYQATEREIFVYSVLGNNDTAVEEFIAVAERYPKNISLSPEVLDVSFCGRRIVMHHGHNPRIIREIIASPPYDVFLRGHSHKPLITKESSLLTVNPGSTAFAIPRSKTWQPTVAVVDTTAMRAEIIIVEMPTAG